MSTKKILNVDEKGAIITQNIIVSIYYGSVCLLCHLSKSVKRWYNMGEEKDITTKDNKEENTMNAYAIRPIMPFATTKELHKTPYSQINREIAEFIDSHDFSFDVNKDTGDLNINIKDKKNEYC